MAQKVLNTKILVRYDTYDNWELVKNSVILAAGEIAVVQVPQNGTATIGSRSLQETPPVALMKIGDGVNVFADLPYLNAVAADVPGWAKSTTPPNAASITLVDANGRTTATTVEAAIDDIYSTISTLQGGNGTTSLNSLQAAIDLLNNNENTPGSVAYAVAQEADRIDGIVGTPDGTTLKDDIDAVAADVDVLNGSENQNGSVAYQIKAITGTPDTGKTLQQEIDAVEANITTLNGDASVAGSVTNTVNTAITNLDLANTYADKAYETKVDTLIGNVTGDNAKSARTMAAEEVAKIVAGADSSFDTLKEIADWIQSDQTGAAKMANDISALKTKTELGTYEDIASNTQVEYDTVKDYVEAYVADQISDLADSSDLTALETRVSANEDAIETLNGDASTTGSVAKAIADVTGTPDAGKTLQGEIDDVEAAITTLNGNDSTAGSVAKTVKDAVDALDYTVTAASGAVDSTDTSKKVLTAFEIENGALKANSVKVKTLADVAFTGDAADLIQANNDFLVLYGGNAAGNYPNDEYSDFFVTD